MNKQSGSKTRPLVWEDQATEESHFRRVQHGVPPTGRVLPGMPLEMPDPDAGDSSRFDSGRRDWGRSGNSSWRPAGAWGRGLLALGVLTVLGGLAASAYLLKTYLDRDARFRIAGADNIEAAGLAEVSRAQMLPVFGEDIGRNVFFVPLGERRKQLEEIPWVERATVMRLLPDRIRVLVVERQPAAFVRHGQQIGLVDPSGVLLDMPASAMAQRHYSFPVVMGIDARDPLPSRKARMAVYERLLAELDANGERLSEQISEIDLTDPEDARVLMPEQGADILAHFGDGRFLERYQRYKAHIAEWKQQYPKLAAVDLRYDRQVVLEMTHGANAVEAAPSDPAAGDAKANPDPKENPEKPAPAESAANTANKAEPKPAQSTKDMAGKAAPGKQAGKAKVVKTGAKAPAKPKPSKEKANRKKRAAAKRAALNQSKRKSAPTARPAAAGQGQ